MLPESLPCLPAGGIVRLDVGRGGGGGEVYEESVLDIPTQAPPTTSAGHGRCSCSGMTQSLQSTPRKRVLLYSLLIATLTAMLFTFNLLMTFLKDLIAQDELWDYLMKQNIKQEE